MKAILGIDAAWTSGQPSGVALAVETIGGWRCSRVAPGYQQFCQHEPVNWDETPTGSVPDVPALLQAVKQLEPQADLRVIAVDMPLSTGPITGRRPADNEVSRAFGARGCAVHSPSATRPGRIADSMRAALEPEFPLATRRAMVPALIEVYPHAALLSLLKLERRLAYKVSRNTRYWPGTPADVRRQRLLQAFNRMLAGLQRKMRVDLPLPAADAAHTFAGLKRYEDCLDSLICAWTAIEYLRGRCQPYGDQNAAIWIPANDADDD
jgi:predicted RNase H-like nuclease